MEQPDLSDCHALVEDLVEEELVGFEANHPKIVETFRQVLAALQSMGI